MTVQELKEKFEALGLPPSLYSLEGQIVDGITLEAYPDNSWRVFVSTERGPFGDAFYYDENEACKRVWEYAQRLVNLYPEETLQKYRVLPKE